MRLPFALVALSLIATLGCTGNILSAAGDRDAVQETAAEPGPLEISTAWPNWRGPNHDGISRETDWTAAWPDAGPKTVWTKQIGIGFSSMAVVNHRVYAMGHTSGQETVWCLNAETGEEIWKHSYKGKLVNNLHEGGPCATPTVDGELVYTVGREGQLFCLKANTGKPVWAKSLPSELGVKLPAWGFSCSPLVLGEKLIVEAGRTVAFNKTTGGILWKTEKYKLGYGSPYAFKLDQQLLLAVLNNDCLMVVRADNGKVLARQRWTTKYATSAATPIVVDGQIFISTGYNQGCALFAFDGEKLKPVYDNRDMRNHFNNCVLWKGNLYGVDGQSNSGRLCKIVCMDFKTGNVKWAERAYGCGSLLIADGKLIILSDKGELVTAEATDAGFKKISSARVLEGKCWTVPVLSNGLIYCRNAAGKLVCVHVRKAAT